mgnify:CR=1 FL=1
MWEMLLDWNELVAQGADVVAYVVMALSGTALFLIRLGFTALGGDADDGLFDVSEMGGDSDAAFSFFSSLSILAFFMGAGWMGLAGRLDWGWSQGASALAASGFGLAAMGVSSGMMVLTRRLNSTPEIDPTSAIGHTARVYLPIPARGEGHGQVEVTVSGRRKIVRAASNGLALGSFEDAVVVDVQDDGCLVVEPKYPKDETSGGSTEQEPS